MFSLNLNSLQSTTNMLNLTFPYISWCFQQINKLAKFKRFKICRKYKKSWKQRKKKRNNKTLTLFLFIFHRAPFTVYLCLELANIRPQCFMSFIFVRVLRKNLVNNTLFYIVLTHADKDKLFTDSLLFLTSSSFGKS
jgi:hypothetical protein